MNTKRNLPEMKELAAKKPKLVAELSRDEIYDSRKTIFGPECQTVDQDRELQSPGEHTFPANNPLNGDTDSELSDISVDCFSDLFTEDEPDRQPVAGVMSWIHRHMELGTDPRHILQEMLPSNIVLPENVDMFMMWKFIFDLITDPQPREKLPDINTLSQVVDLLKTCKNILVLTGAGVSVSCGIPDFRSRDGIYARLSKEYPDLPDPQAMFDINYFRSNTKPFYKFAKEIYPGKFKPSLSHRFIHYLEKKNKLLRNYTQNIDTLEREAGITRVIECHGSFSTASCTNCQYNVSSSVIKNDIFNQVTPLCPKCTVSEDTLSVMKPDIVFFGESLPHKFHDCIEQDIKQVDLLIVVGSSLKVRPVNLIPNQIPCNVPQILINREPLPSMNFDVELLGDCDTITAYLCKQLGESWCEVLQGFQVPNVSQELLTPLIQTPPDSPIKDDRKKNICNGNDAVEKQSYSCDSKETVENDLLEDCLDKDKDVAYIFLPPCRYIFHGAEIGRCDSFTQFEDGTEIHKSYFSSKSEEELSFTEYGQVEQEEDYKLNSEQRETVDTQDSSPSELDSNVFSTNTDCSQTLE